MYIFLLEGLCVYCHWAGGLHGYVCKYLHNELIYRLHLKSEGHGSSLRVCRSPAQLLYGHSNPLLTFLWVWSYAVPTLVGWSPYPLCAHPRWENEKQKIQKMLCPQHPWRHCCSPPISGWTSNEAHMPHGHGSSQSMKTEVESHVVLICKKCTEASKGSGQC